MAGTREIPPEFSESEAGSVQSIAINIDFTPALRSTSELSGAPTASSDVVYDDYYDYVCKIVEQHPDIHALKGYLDSYDDPLQKDKRTAVYIVDFVPSNMNVFQPIIHGVCTTAEELQTLLDEQDDVVELRLVIVSHEDVIDREILKTLGYEMDIDPRIFIEHMGSLLPKSSAYFATPYLPSEASRSPIEIHFGGGKSTATLLQPHRSSVKSNTVLVLIDPPAEHLEAALRDFERPTLRKSHVSSLSLAVPDQMNLTYRYLRRLSELHPSEIDVCCQHPIYLILPLLHLCSLETSMLLTWAEEKLYERRQPHNLYERDPYNAYITSEGFQQEIFTSTMSLKSHMISPWMDSTNDTAEFVNEKLKCAFQDLDFLRDKAALVQQSVTDALNREAATQSINEARQSVAQTESVNKLTRLAFVFIPLTFATSLFGMNIREWQDEDKVPKLTSFVIVAITITFGTIFIVLAAGFIFRILQKRWKSLGLLRRAFSCSYFLGVFYATFSLLHRPSANRRLAVAMGIAEGSSNEDVGEFEWLTDGFWLGKWWRWSARVVYQRAVEKDEARELKLAEKMV